MCLKILISVDFETFFDRNGVHPNGVYPKKMLAYGLYPCRKDVYGMDEYVSKHRAYVRVSTVEQNSERQRVALAAYGIDEWYEDKLSGKDTNRDGLERLRKDIRKGDTIYVHDFSRLARSLKDLIDLVNEFQNKGASLYFHTEHIDTKTDEGQMMLGVVGSVYDFERKIIRRRQLEGIALAKEKGVYAGRKRKKVKDFKRWYDMYMNREITLVQMAKMLNVSRSTAYRLIDEYRAKKKSK